ncbi:MAG: permease [Rikenellaceae bacterium]|nr:permease [Rikenellaceae bacterium]
MIQTYLMPFLTLLFEMAPYLLLGFLIAGVLHAFVPQRIYHNHLADSSFRSVVWAALFGIPLPLCSCGVIPTAMSLRKNGASKGAAVSFLIATPQTGVDSILATASLLGLPFAILRPVAALCTALFGGALVNRFGGSEGDQPLAEKGQQEVTGSFAARLAKALRYGFEMMLQDIGKWLLIGLVIAGLITIFVPAGFFTTLSEYPLLNMLLVLAFSIPMYLCATGSIPIAAALILKGLSPGAALVLLMAGPATNMAAILVINKVLGRKTLWLYLLSIVGGAIAFGWVVDALLPTEWFAGGAVAACASCTGAPLAWWKVTSGVLFLVLLVRALILKRHPHAPVAATPTERRFAIRGMRCNHCRANVEKALAALEGVTSARVVLDEGAAYLTGNFSEEAVRTTVAKMGFEVVEE